LGDFVMAKEQKDFPKHTEPEKLAKPAKEDEKLLAKEKEELLPKADYKELEDTVMRLQAEFENYQKRSRKEYEERFDLGKMDLAKAMVDFADEFENALKHMKGEERKGVEMIYASYLKTLSAHGVRPMECIGQKFDPYLHDVLSALPSDKPEGVVLETVKKGYYFKDRVLRHAAVVVAKKKE
jgi:molecular chaperone GrpE